MTICLGQIEFRIFFAGAGAFGGESYFSTFLRWKNVKILFSLENYNNISAEAKQSYQFVHSTWFDMKKKYNFPCFVENVKKIILYLIFYSKFLWIWSTTLFEKLLVSKQTIQSILDLAKSVPIHRVIINKKQNWNISFTFCSVASWIEIFLPYPEKWEITISLKYKLNSLLDTKQSFQFLENTIFQVKKVYKCPYFIENVTNMML